MLKSDTATIMKMSRSYSRPNACSSQRIERFSAVHRIAAAVFLAGLDIDFQRDLAAGHGDEGVFDAAERAADHREQIGRLRKRIVPDREMPAVRQIAAFDQIAVGEQYRRLRLVGFDAGRVDRHHVRPVREIGDAAEAFRLALRAIGAARPVQPHQLGIGGGIDNGLDRKLERRAAAAARASAGPGRRHSHRARAACRRARSTTA